MKYFVYVIKNEKDKIYIGQTNDLEKRLQRHNNKLPHKTKSYTSKMGGAWSLIYHEELQTRQDVLSREKQLKSYQGIEFIKSIIRTRGVSSVGRAVAS